MQKANLLLAKSLQLSLDHVFTEIFMEGMEKVKEMKPYKFISVVSILFHFSC